MQRVQTTTWASLAGLLLFAGVPVLAQEPLPTLSIPSKTFCPAPSCNLTSSVTPTATGPDGGIYIAAEEDISSSGIKMVLVKLSGKGDFLWGTSFAPSRSSDVSGVAIDGAGNSYVSITDDTNLTSQVAKFGPDGGSPIKTVVLPAPDGLGGSSGVAFDISRGRLYASTDTGNSVLVAVYDSDLNLLNTAIYDPPSGFLAFTEGAPNISLDSNGNVYVGGEEDGFRCTFSACPQHYLVLKWAPELSSQIWVAKQDATPGSGNILFPTGRANPNGGFTIVGFEAPNNYVLRQVSADGSRPTFVRSRFSALFIAAVREVML